MEKSISSNEVIVIFFSKSHKNYHYTYKQICKDDNFFHHSKHYHNLDNPAPPQMEKSAQANQKSRTLHAQENPTKVQQRSRRRKQDPGNLQPNPKSVNF